MIKFYKTYLQDQKKTAYKDQLRNLFGTPTVKSQAKFDELTNMIIEIKGSPLC